MYWVIMWVKYTFPRIRIDQMLNFNWKFLTPLSLVILMVTAVLDKLLPRGANGGLSATYVIVMLAVNLVIGWITFQILRSRARIERKRVGEPRPVAVPPQPPVSSPTA